MCPYQAWPLPPISREALSAGNEAGSDQSSAHILRNVCRTSPYGDNNVVAVAELRAWVSTYYSSVTPGCESDVDNSKLLIAALVLMVVTRLSQALSIYVRCNTRLLFS
jgi:hypothetical protein